MPTIRVDAAVYEALQKLAEPFVDTPNSVLRRLLSLDAENATDDSKKNSTDDSKEAARNQNPVAARESRYQLESGGVTASAVRVGAKGMRVLFAESPLKEMASLSDSNRDIRRRLLKDGYFEKTAANRYQLTRPYEFASPSAASSVLLGHESNGRLEWKDSGGTALGSR